MNTLVLRQNYLDPKRGLKLKTYPQLQLDILKLAMGVLNPKIEKG